MCFLKKSGAGNFSGKIGGKSNRKKSAGKRKKENPLLFFGKNFEVRNKILVYNLVRSLVHNLYYI